MSRTWRGAEEPEPRALSVGDWLRVLRRGGAILALTAWVAVFCMWVGAVATQLVLTSRPSGQTAAT